MSDYIYEILEIIQRRKSLNLECEFLILDPKTWMNIRSIDSEHISYKDEWRIVGLKVAIVESSEFLLEVR